MSKEDIWRHIYAFLSCQNLHQRECCFVDIHLKGKGLEPSTRNDFHFASIGGETLPPWQEVKARLSSARTPEFTCTGALDQQGILEVTMSAVSGNLVFLIYGDYEQETLPIITEIKEKAAELNCTKKPAFAV